MGAALWIGIGANAVTAAAYVAVALLLLANAVKTHHVRDNPLGVATVLIFLTCGGGHFIHMLQLAEVPLGYAGAAGVAIQAEYENNPHMWLIDIVTAAAGVAYWLLRRRFPGLVSGAAVFEDLRERQRRALEINDNVVQGLTRAKMALDMQQKPEGDLAVADTLSKARHIITDLLGDDDIQAGALRRERPGTANTASAGGKP